MLAQDLCVSCVHTQAALVVPHGASSQHEQIGIDAVLHTLNGWLAHVCVWPNGERGRRDVYLCACGCASRHLASGLLQCVP